MWQWVENLTDQNKKAMYWNARCPYHGCPSNQPFNGAHKARLKFIQKIAPMVQQYKCKDCGCLTNYSLEQPDGNELKGLNPALHGGKPDYV